MYFLISARKIKSKTALKVNIFVHLFFRLMLVLEANIILWVAVLLFDFVWVFLWSYMKWKLVETVERKLEVIIFLLMLKKNCLNINFCALYIIH